MTTDGTGRARELSILDAAYDPEPDDHAWLTRLTAVAAELLDEGCGVHGMFVDLDSAMSLRDPVLVGGSAAWRACWRRHWWDELIVKARPEAHRAMLRFAPVSRTTELFAAVAARVDTFGELLRRMEARGFQHALASERPAHGPRRLFYPDSLNVVGIDASGVGVALVANRAVKANGPLPAPWRRLLSRLAGHLAAAARLRRRAPRARTEDFGAEGITSSEGKVLHAAGAGATNAGLAALRAAARDVVRARRGQVADPLQYWRALHAGRWTIVERFETDGRRVLVARENRADVAVSLDELSEREKRVLGELASGLTNKEIGYRLGIETSTVATYLQRLKRKLRARDAFELVRIARSPLDRRPVDRAT